MKHLKFTKIKKRYDTLKNDITLLSQKISGDKEILSLKEKQIKQVKSDLDKLKIPLSPVVTNHAIIQYIGRVMNFDIQELTETILNDDILEMIKKSGDGHYRHEEGFKIVVKNNVVTTIEL